MKVLKTMIAVAIVLMIQWPVNAQSQELANEEIVGMWVYLNSIVSIQRRCGVMNSDMHMKAVKLLKEAEKRVSKPEIKAIVKKMVSSDNSPLWDTHKRIRKASCDGEEVKAFQSEFNKWYADNPEQWDSLKLFDKFFHVEAAI